MANNEQLVKFIIKSIVSDVEYDVTGDKFTINRIDISDDLIDGIIAESTKYGLNADGERCEYETITEEKNFQYVEYAYVLVVDVESGAEELFKKETREVTLQASQPIQNLGGKNTYMKRYMYMDVFEINENDSVEEETGAPVNVETTIETKPKSRKKPAVQEVSTKPAENITPYDFMPQQEPAVVGTWVPQETPVTAPVVSAPVEVAPQNTEESTEVLMSMETKISLAETIKNAGLDPRTAIIEFAQALDTDVPFLKESDKDKILEMINKKVGK